MDVCVLNLTELARLERHGARPHHPDHYHISAKEALQGIREDVYRLVDGMSFAVVEQSSNGRAWQKTASGGVMVMQLVRSRAAYVRE